MSLLREASDEKKAWTQPVKAFNRMVTDLEERIMEDQLDDDVENALKEMAEAYKVVYNLQKAYLAARQGSDSEELEDDPEDVKWMDKNREKKAEVLTKYHTWKKSKAAGEAEAANAREEKRLARERAKKEADLAREKAVKDAELVREKEDKLQGLIR